VLDQRRLPAQETWLRCETAEQVAECIRSMAVRGAPAIGLAAAYGLALAGNGFDAAADELAATRRLRPHPSRGRTLEGEPPGLEL
jgi:methylthioribose-1-phosphate isomerase